MKETTRKRILHTAGQFFFSEGLNTGIDRIILECDLGKMTLKAHSASKDGLICALLDKTQQGFDRRFRELREDPALDISERLAPTFTVLCHGMNDPTLRVGLGVRALVEFPQAHYPVHLAGLQLERAILALLESACAAAALTDCEDLARQLLLLARGSFALAPLLGSRGGGALAIRLAQTLIAVAVKAILEAPASTPTHPTMPKPPIEALPVEETCQYHDFLLRTTNGTNAFPFTVTGPGALRLNRIVSGATPLLEDGFLELETVAGRVVLINTLFLIGISRLDFVSRATTRPARAPPPKRPFSSSTASKSR